MRGEVAHLVELALDRVALRVVVDLQELDRVGLPIECLRACRPRRNAPPPRRFWIS
jgi:hypothetical protein